MTNRDETRVYIFNRALSIARQGKTISGYDEQSNLARLCRLHYDAARREALAAFDWSFALKVIKASRLDAKEFGVAGYKYLFVIPADNIVIRGVYSSFEEAKQKKPVNLAFSPETVIGSDGNIYIGSDLEEIYIKYIQDNEAYPFWNPAFMEYVSACLSLRIGQSLSLSAVKIAEITNDKTRAYMTAATLLSTEKNNNDVSKDRRYIKARG